MIVLVSIKFYILFYVIGNDILFYDINWVKYVKKYRCVIFKVNL